MLDELEEHRFKTGFATIVNHGYRPVGEVVDIVCPCCQRFMLIRKRRLNTAYVNDESNWMISCDNCYEEAVEYYSDLWDMYYQDIM